GARRHFPTSGKSWQEIHPRGDWNCSVLHKSFHQTMIFCTQLPGSRTNKPH
ncbi:hypothetical protein ACHAW6_008562, partial [Cyclotella cf. meneghiniana]